MESVDPKTSRKTLFRFSEGPGTKKYPSKDGVRIRAKKKKCFNCLPGRYMHFKIISKGVLRHAEIPRPTTCARDVFRRTDSIGSF